MNSTINVTNELEPLKATKNENGWFEKEVDQQQKQKHFSKRNFEKKHLEKEMRTLKKIFLTCCLFVDEENTC